MTSHHTNFVDRWLDRNHQWWVGSITKIRIHAEYIVKHPAGDFASTDDFDP